MAGQLLASGSKRKTSSLSLDLYHKVAKLGEGAYGEVYRWDLKSSSDQDESSENPKQVAIKEIIERQMHSNWEVINLHKLEHENIVGCFGTITLEPGCKGLVMELCQGTLKNLMEAPGDIYLLKREFRLYEISRILKQILQGLAYLHRNKIIHRDVKPANILLLCKTQEFVKWKTVNTGTLVAKLTDFGLSRHFDKSRNEDESLSLVGTLKYWAPEIKQAVLNNEKPQYDEGADIWPTGMIALGMYKGGGTSGLRNSDVPTVISNLENTSNNFKSFVSTQLAEDSRERSSATTLLQNSFIANFVPTEAGDIFHAIKTNDLDYAKELCNVHNLTSIRNMDDYTPLLQACEDGNLEIAKLLLEKGSDINGQSKEGLSPLLVASLCGNAEIVRELISQGCNIYAREKRGFDSLVAASQNGHIEVVKDLIREGCRINDCNVDGATALHFASKNGHLDIVKELFEEGKYINAPDRKGITPLMAACDEGQIQVMRFLIDCGCDVSARDYHNANSLHRAAAFCDDPSIIRFLLNAGADFRVKDDDGDDALSCAAAGGNINSFKELLLNGADLNTRNNKGMTLLHNAASYRRHNMVRFLVEDLSFDVNVFDFSNETPLDKAEKEFEEKEHSDDFPDEDYEISLSHTVSFLIKNGANPGQ